MPYPTLSRELAQNIAEDILSAIDDGANPITHIAESSYSGIVWKQGPDYDRLAIERCSTMTRSELLRGYDDNSLLRLSNKEQTLLESQMSSRLHATLEPFETVILQDPDFWRYLALFPFRWFTLAREPELKPQDFGGVRTVYKDDIAVGYRGTDFKYQLIFRCYLWGKCAFDPSDSLGGPGESYRRATAIEADNTSIIDVWHSHMVRTQMGHLAEMPHAFIDVVAGSEALSTDEARELEKLITRMKHNVLFDTYTYDETLSLVLSQVPYAKERAAALPKNRK